MGQVQSLGTPSVFEDADTALKDDDGKALETDPSRANSSAL